MSGLVQRLIARSREPVTGIRPRPASLYEDQPPMTRAQAEPPALFDAPDPARPTGVPATRLQRPAAQEADVYAEHEIQVERSPRAPREARHERTPPLTEPEAADPAGAVRAARAARRAPAAPPRPHFPADRPDSPLPGLAEAGRAAGAPLLRVAAGPVLAAPARPSRAQTAQDAPAPPVVEISIGRLEVRAPQAQAAPQARPPRKDHASVLQRYLRGRSKGELA
ncbi:hypothetical protein ACFPOI_32970 [Nonomuraea angiospora]|uniref:Uncharacterized protein n=1 Tax=Nonomuraea angiospora TaxID=46172 RepID=A0ABR9LU79_9ACTN|nr:hypothetical protein [Nonomuraea angiospora]MBE1583646.1 hypothetical protein [Nonomuraea angiospora]